MCQILGIGSYAHIGTCYPYKCISMSQEQVAPEGKESKRKKEKKGIKKEEKTSWGWAVPSSGQHSNYSYSLRLVPSILIN